MGQQRQVDDLGVVLVRRDLVAVRQRDDGVRGAVIVRAMGEQRRRRSGVRIPVTSEGLDIRIKSVRVVARVVIRGDHRLWRVQPRHSLAYAGSWVIDTQRGSQRC